MGGPLALLETPCCACRVAWVQPTAKGVVKTHPQDTELDWRLSSYMLLSS